MCREFGLVNSTIQTIWKNRTKIISPLDQDASRTMQFLKPERRDVDEAQLKWFKQERNDSVPVTGPIHVTPLFLLNINFKVMYCLA